MGMIKENINLEKIDPPMMKNLIVKRLRGLSNEGNTCYENAIWQCLLATPFFAQCVLDEKANHVNDGVSTELKMLCKSFVETAPKHPHEQVKAYATSGLIEALVGYYTDLSVPSIVEMLRTRNQQDAGYFFHDVVGRWLFNNREQLQMVKQFMTESCKLPPHCTICKTLVMTENKQQRIVVDVDITLLLGVKQESVQAALSAPEMTYERPCATCGKDTTFVNGRFYFRRLPYIFVFAVANRDTHFVITEEITVQHTHYRLYAACMHQGDESGGHYVAYVKYNLDSGAYRRWFVASDGSVYNKGAITFEKLLAGQRKDDVSLTARLLFYERHE